MNVAEFAERVLHQPLWPHQLDAAHTDRFIVAIAGGRRSGKSQLAQIKALHVAYTHRDARVLVVSPVIDNSRNFLADLADLVAQSSMAQRAVVDLQAQVVSFKNGSEIRCLPATSGQVRGRGRNLRLAVCDEAAFLPSNVWRDLRYTLFDHRAEGSQAFLICSPWGPPEHFFRASFDRGRKGDPDYASFQWPMAANPNLDPAMIAKERENTAPSEAAAEIDGEWSDAIGSLFPRELLERQTADLELPALSELEPPARGVIGLDWGVSFDKSAAAAIYRLPVNGLNPELEPKPRFVVIPHVWPVKTPLAQVVGDVVAVGDAFGYVASETNGVGAMPSQELFSQLRSDALRAERPRPRVRYEIATTSRSKTAGYGAILSLLEREQLVLPRHPDLLRQLAGLRFEQGERGFTRIEAESFATHDDVADALQLAALPWRRPGGQLRSHLAEFANAEHAVADAELRPVDHPTVTTGGGLRLWRRPPLQSVTGPEITAPKSARPQGVVGRLRALQRQQEVLAA